LTDMDMATTTTALRPDAAERELDALLAARAPMRRGFDLIMHKAADLARRFPADASVLYTDAGGLGMVFDGARMASARGLGDAGAFDEEYEAAAREEEERVEAAIAGRTGKDVPDAAIVRLVVMPVVMR